MPFTVTARVEGTERVAAMLRRPGERARSFKPAFRKIYENFLQVNLRQFLSEGRYGRTPWKPLSAGYAEWKRKNYPGKTILRRADRTFRSLIPQPSGDAVYQTTFTKSFMGTKVPYARHADKPRPIVVITREQRRIWPKIIMDHLMSRDTRIR